MVSKIARYRMPPVNFIFARTYVDKDSRELVAEGQGASAGHELRNSNATVVPINEVCYSDTGRMPSSVQVNTPTNESSFYLTHG